MHRSPCAMHAGGAAQAHALASSHMPPARYMTCHARRKKQPAGRGFGGNSSSGGIQQDVASRSEETDAGAQPVATPQSDAGTGMHGAVPSQGALPRVSRGRVFQTCAKISGAMAGGGLLLRLAAPYTSAALGADSAAVQFLLAGPQLLNAQHLAVMLSAAAGITGSRQALLAVWPDFVAATDASNRQVLSPLAPYDLVWLAALPGISEEVLFRGALIPALLPDWRGVLLAGAAFGVLHNSGGRNWAFAAWAAAVGCIYGAIYLQTGDISVPIGAHTLANLAGAVLWLQFRKNPKGRCT